MRRKKFKNPGLIFLKKAAVVFCLTLFFCFSSSAQNYANPVIPGDFPDPSVIRVADDYYATATKGGKETLGIVVAQRTVSTNYTATTQIDYTNLKSNEFAGLSAYSWRGSALGISLGNGKIFIWRRQNGVQQEISSVLLPTGKSLLQLRLSAADGTFNFAYSENGKDWKPFEKTIDGNYIEGARLALIYNGKSTTGAKFDWFHVGQ